MKTIEFPEYCVLFRKGGNFVADVQNKKGETKRFYSAYRSDAVDALHEYRRLLKVETEPDFQDYTK